MQERTCPTCGNPFTPRSHNQKFCSDRCGRTAWRMRRLCSIEACGRPSNTDGLCKMHVTRLRLHGDVGGPHSTKGPNSPDGQLGVYDHGDGYRITRIRVNGKSIKVLEHRYVMEQMLGRPLEPEENVHHINGDKLDNRPENLELWLTKQPKGQRVADLIAFVVEHYRSDVIAQLKL